MERYLERILGSTKFEDVSATRSKTMSAIRGKGNKTTELTLKMALVRARISGWHLQHHGQIGKPDFYFPQAGVVIFVDGCFWHGCPRCGHTPKTRSAFWVAKFLRNQARDKAVTRELRQHGLTVLRVWEHELQNETNLGKVVRKIRSLAHQ